MMKITTVAINNNTSRRYITMKSVLNAKSDHLVIKFSKEKECNKKVCV